MNRTERLRLDALTAARQADTHRRTATIERDNAVARAMHWGASWADIADGNANHHWNACAYSDACSDFHRNARRNADAAAD